MVRKRIEELTIEDMKPLTISWKTNQDDFELFKWIYSHSNYSGFVKDILRQKMNEDYMSIKQTTTIKEEKTKSKGLLEFNF